MAAKRKRSNPRSRRDYNPITNRQVVGKKIIHMGHDVTWFYSPEVIRRRMQWHQELMHARQTRKQRRRAALGAALLMSEDNRRWNPNPIKPAHSVAGPTRHRLSIGKSTSMAKQSRLPMRLPSKRSGTLFTSPMSVPFPTSRVIFTHSNKIAVCVRRKRRREVLMATGQHGGHGGRRRIPRRNINSSVGC